MLRLVVQFHANYVLNISTGKSLKIGIFYSMKRGEAGQFFKSVNRFWWVVKLVNSRVSSTNYMVIIGIGKNSETTFGVFGVAG